MIKNQIYHATIKRIGNSESNAGNFDAYTFSVMLYSLGATPNCFLKHLVK
jgi:hypothetical protein